jgi:hypothetical protein
MPECTRRLCIPDRGDSPALGTASDAPRACEFSLMLSNGAPFLQRREFLRQTVINIETPTC